MTHNLTHDGKNPGGDNGADRTRMFPDSEKRALNGGKSAPRVFRWLFGTMRPWVQIPPLGPNNDNPNYILQVGNVFGFIIFIENVL